jgi:hypothetical protein
VFLRGNSFHDNGAHPVTGPGLGVDVVQLQGSDPVFGVNTNLPGSLIGPDGLQNYPTLAGAAGSGGRVRVVGTLNARKSNSYTVELFANARCGASGFGEGETKVGGVTVSTDGNGEAPIDAKVSLPKDRRVITAMATGPQGSSEFSQCLKPSGSKSAGAVLAPDGLTPSASGNVTLDVWCLDKKPCDGTATLDQTTQRAVGTSAAATSRSRGGRHLGVSKFKARAGRRVRVKIKLTKASRALLKKKHRLRVRATVKLKHRRGAAASHAITYVLSRR